MSAKDLKEITKGVAEAHGLIKCYIFTESDMQAFEDAICREQRQLCVDSITLGKPMKETIINAKKPTT